MTQAIAYRGRLPGVRCDPALPPVADDAIRLDVAAFVGFAERGPVDDPQPVEDPAQYATVFGGDLPLAIDEHGVPVYAALPDAVRSFFANGGRRAYVVRVVGRAATTLPVPGRVVSRRPLDARTAIVGLDLGTLGPQRALVPTTDAGPLVELGAASPGGWAGRITIDADVVDTVLSLRTDASGEVALTATSRRLVDEGDAVLVRRADQWLQLWAPPAGDALAPAGGWQQGDVARLLRADLTVRRAGDGTTIAVEQFAGLRLGRATTSIGVRSRSWLDVLQPAAGGFVRDRSMFLRAPVADALVPRLGPLDAEVQPDPLPREADAGADADTAGIADGSSPIEVGAVLPPPFSRAALHADGLAELDPVALFLDPDLTGHTIDGLRLAMEVLELADVPHARGVHAIALQPDVAIVAVPDLYHRPWHDQFVVDPSADQLPTTEPPADLPPAVGFQHCAPPAPPVVT
ncbi:MAG: hypothetical protein JWM12_366, partial [Ilumatobacteraceae bacterium]|nr:hypothetical protein [Ilumatobacteraceae bacterium]